MDGMSSFWAESDAISRLVVALLLGMSVSAWVLIFWKGWVLQRARHDIARAVPAFWSADTLAAGRTRLDALDREQVLLPLLDAASTPDAAGGHPLAKQVVGQHRRDCHRQTGGGHDQRLADRAGHLVYRHRAGGRYAQQRVVNAPDRAEQAYERRRAADRGQQHLAKLQVG